MLERKKKARK